MDSTATSPANAEKERATILLVDDNTANLQVLRDTLDHPEHPSSQLGYRNINLCLSISPFGIRLG